MKIVGQIFDPAERNFWRRTGGHRRVGPGSGEWGGGRVPKGGKRGSCVQKRIK